MPSFILLEKVLRPSILNRIQGSGLQRQNPHEMQLRQSFDLHNQFKTDCLNSAGGVSGKVMGGGRHPDEFISPCGLDSGSGSAIRPRQVVMIYLSILGVQLRVYLSYAIFWAELHGTIMFTSPSIYGLSLPSPRHRIPWYSDSSKADHLRTLCYVVAFLGRISLRSHPGKSLINREHAIL